VTTVILWIAQGFGVGRLKPAPGTWGSLVGMVLVWLLMLTGRTWSYCACVVMGLLLSVCVCGQAEKILGVKDHQSIVLDEITAVPVCFLGPVMAVSLPSGKIPPVGELMTTRNLLLAFGLFASFRLFDIWKPWPVRQSQQLPGGLGVTADDVLAAVYVNLVWFLAYLSILMERRACPHIAFQSAG